MFPYRPIKVANGTSIVIFCDIGNASLRLYSLFVNTPAAEQLYKLEDTMYFCVEF